MAAIGGHSQRRRRLRARIIFGVLLFVSIILFFASRANDRVLDRTRSETADVVSPVMTYLMMPVRGFENMVMDWRELTKAHSENIRLKSELERLSEIEARSNAMEVMLSRFEDILNVEVSSGMPEQKIAARAVAENNGPFVRSTLLNAGVSKGLKKGYGVMTADGLLGHVVRVGENSARVLRLEDLNSRVSVMAVRSQSRAILTGDNSPLPKLSFITEGSDWLDGDVVITSGDDGVLPQGLPIGYVTLDGVGDMRVKLYVNDNHVDWVWVYPFDGFKAPEDDPVLEIAETAESGVEDTSDNISDDEDGSLENESDSIAEANVADTNSEVRERVEANQP